MKNIGLISDTHSYMGEDVLELLKECDEIWHAGDIGNIKVIDQLEKLDIPLRVVYGNIDDAVCRQSFPLNQIFEIEGIKVFITHIGGYPGRYTNRVKELINIHKPNLFICGHSHICKVMPDHKNNLLHMNPGACGHYGFHKFRTILLFQIVNGEIKNLRVAEIGKRGRIDNS